MLNFPNIVPTQAQMQALGKGVDNGIKFISKKSGQAHDSFMASKPAKSLKTNFSQIKSMVKDQNSCRVDTKKYNSMYQPTSSNTARLKNIIPNTRNLASKFMTEHLDKKISSLNKKDAPDQTSVSKLQNDKLKQNLQTLKAELSIKKNERTDAKINLEQLNSKLKSAQEITGNKGIKSINEAKASAKNYQNNYTTKWEAKLSNRFKSLHKRAEKHENVTKFKSDNESFLKGHSLINTATKMTATKTKYKLKTAEKNANTATDRTMKSAEITKSVKSKFTRAEKKEAYIENTKKLIPTLVQKIDAQKKIIKELETNLTLAKKEITVALLEKFLHPSGDFLPSTTKKNGTCKDFKDFCKDNKECLTSLVKEKIPNTYTEDHKLMIAESIINKMSNTLISGTLPMGSLAESISKALDSPPEGSTRTRILLLGGNSSEVNREAKKITQDLLPQLISKLDHSTISDADKKLIDSSSSLDNKLNKAAVKSFETIIKEFPLVLKHGLEKLEKYEGWGNFEKTITAELQNLSNISGNKPSLEQHLQNLPAAVRSTINIKIGPAANNPRDFIPQVQHEHLNDYLAQRSFDEPHKKLTSEKINELKALYPAPTTPPETDTKSTTSAVTTNKDFSHTSDAVSSATPEKPLPAIPENSGINTEIIKPKDTDLELKENARLSELYISNFDNQKQNLVDSGIEDIISSDDSESIRSFVTANSDDSDDSESIRSFTSAKTNQTDD